MIASYLEMPGRQEAPVPHTVAALVAGAVSAPDKTALAYLGRSFSYLELAGMAAAAAAAFDRAGLRAGDRLIIQLQNVPQFVIALLGAWAHGIIAVPVSPMYRSREVRKIAADSGAGAILTSPDLWASQGFEIVDDSTLSSVLLTAMEDFAAELPDRLLSSRENVERLPEIPGVTVTDFTAVLRQETFFDAAALTGLGKHLTPEDTALLAYTSGTTGPPKGAAVSHRNLVEAGWTYATVNEVKGRDEVLLCIAPLVHITGIGVNMVTWLLAGNTMVLGYRFHPLQALQEIERWRATWTVGAATAFVALLTAAEQSDRDISTLRRATSGGAAVPAAMLKRFERLFGFPLLPGFGMTEVSGSICSTPVGDGPRIDPQTGLPSVGLVHPGSAVCIQDPDGNVVDRGDRGEICLRGPGVVSGYWNNGAATAETFRQGWLRTGDVGFMDETGWVYLVDRTKNMIIASGYKVWPREVEEVINGIEGVLEVAVIGIPDPYRGETVKAVVSLQSGAALSEQQIIAHCQQNMAAYKVPASVEFRHELPKNANGKILHRSLRQDDSQRIG